MSAGPVTRRVTPNPIVGSERVNPDPEVDELTCVIDLWFPCPAHGRVHDGDVTCLFTADLWF